MAMRKKLTHMKNKRMDEGALRNVLLELKEVVKPIGQYDKQVSSANRELSNWAGTQTMAICKFLGDLGQVEERLTAVNSHYIKDYLEFCAMWKSILAERKELKALIDRHKEAESVLEGDKKRLMDAQKKAGKAGSKQSLALEANELAKKAVTDAGTDEPGEASDDIAPEETKEEIKRERSRPKLSKVKKGSSVDVCKAAVGEAAVLVDQLTKEIRDKELGVQKDIHNTLRSAYYELFASRLLKCKREAKLYDDALAVVCNFPKVLDYDKENTDSFHTEPYKEVPGPAIDAIWHRGETLQKNLEIERESARHALDLLKARQEDALSKAQKTFDEDKKSLEEQLADLHRQHDALVASLTEASQLKEGNLQSQVNALTLEKHSLKESVRALQKGMVQLSLNQSLKTIQSAQEACDRDIVAFFLDKCVAAIEMLKQLAAKSDWAKSEFVITSNNFAREAASTLMSAVGSAQTLKMEKATALVALAKRACESSVVFVQASAALLHPDQDAQETVSAPDDAAVKKDFDELLAIAKSLNTEQELPSEVADSVSAAQKMIADTLETIRHLRETCQKEQKGRQLEVNLNLLDTARTMFEHASSVISSSLNLQHELKVDSASINAEGMILQRKWVESLQSAVDTVAESAPLWSECTRQVVRGQGMHEELQVATRGLAAFSAQLVATSRTRETTMMGSSQGEVATSTNNLISTSHKLLDSIREAQNLQLASILLEDFNSLSKTQAKKMIMNTQVEVLKLENDLERSREKLGRLRRINYDDMKASSKPASKASSPEKGEPAAESKQELAL